MPEERLSKQAVLDRFRDVTYTDDAGDEHCFIERFIKEKYRLELCGFDQCFYYFQETHDKVGGEYVRTRKDPVTSATTYEILSKKLMCEEYQHYGFGDRAEGSTYDLKTHFVSEYLSDHRIDSYLQFGIYPGSLRPPPKVFNLWTPFAVERTVRDPWELEGKQGTVGTLSVSSLEVYGFQSKYTRS
jgi:hypothetical protein